MILPRLIQGGMGVAVSGWILARTVSLLGQLGVVSGTGIEVVFIRRLQNGDPGGHLRRAVEAFPDRKAALAVYEQYYCSGGIKPGQSYKTVAMPTIEPALDRQRLCVIAAFCEVFLAKEGHDGVVGINLLEKIQLPNPWFLYGAMLADVDYVLMGAGIPTEIPGLLDQLAEGDSASLKITVHNQTRDWYATVNPAHLFAGVKPTLKRPKFLAIVSSVVLAKSLLRRSTGEVDGFVVELPIAGGHNAPPRTKGQYTETGEPLYGARDEVDFEEIRGLGKPFWLAGGYGNPAAFQVALESGAQGVQVGTAFAFSRESGLDPTYRIAILQGVLEGNVTVFTDPNASPTGFPFKVVQLEGTLSDQQTYEARQRVCDMGHLRRLVEVDNKIVYLCPAEPVDDYVKKGGCEQDTVGRKCLCNGLAANVLVGQRRKGVPEGVIFTAGDDLTKLGPMVIQLGGVDYSAADVVTWIIGKN